MEQMQRLRSLGVNTSNASMVLLFNLKTSKIKSGESPDTRISGGIGKR